MSARQPGSPRLDGALRLLLGAVLLGLASGVAHTLWLLVRQHVLGLIVWQPREYPWLLPMAYVCLQLAVVAPLVAIRFAMPRVPLRWATFVLATMAALSVALLVPRVHHLALLAVSIGVGVRLSGLLASDAAGARRKMARSTAALAALVAMAALATRTTWSLRERAAARELPRAPDGAPNVLLIILDTVRAASMSFQGRARETTPRLARRGAEGAVFDWAFSPSSWTLQSHASFFTGRVPADLTASWSRPLDRETPTLTEVFARRGYRTGGFAANLLYTARHSGLDRSFEHYEDYRRSWRQLLLGTTLLQTQLFWSLREAAGAGEALRALARLDLKTNVLPIPDRKLAWEVGQEFLAWQASLGGRPFFAFLNYYDAHMPYDPPDGFATRFSDTPAPLDRYEGAIAYLDREVGALLDSLEARGVLEHTIVAITSDHGEAFGEHGATGHGNGLWLTELHVPLILRYPRSIPAGLRVTHAVTLRELPATLLQLAGVTGTPLPGRSLARYWDVALEASSGGPVIAQVDKGINAEPGAPLSRGDMSAVLDDQWHFIVNGDGTEELFAYRLDRGETRNLATTDSGRAELPRLRSQLQARREAATAAPPRR